MIVKETLSRRRGRGGFSKEDWFAEGSPANWEYPGQAKTRVDQMNYYYYIYVIIYVCIYQGRDRVCMYVHISQGPSAAFMGSRGDTHGLQGLM